MVPEIPAEPIETPIEPVPETIDETPLDKPVEPDKPTETIPDKPLDANDDEDE
jgi:hypothetical protein